MARTPIGVIVVVFDDDDSDFMTGKVVEDVEEGVTEVGLMVGEMDVFIRGFV